MNATGSTTSQIHILVVDDSPINRMLARALLRRHGYAVTVVKNGREALEAISGGQFDAVLMDIDMPEMDGLSATRQIRAAEAPVGGRVPILAVTTNDNASECLQAGMDAHLVKPLRPESLNRALASILRRNVA
jgi:CheY-like chemotaxis protein